MKQRNLKIDLISSGRKGKEVAEIMGVSEASVSSWINRKRRVPDEYKVKFAKLLGVGVTDLLPKPVDEGAP